MFEVYKYSNGVSPDIMNTVFKLRQNTTWKISTQFKSSKQKVYFNLETSQLICYAHQLTGLFMRATLALNGLNRIKYRASQIWKNVSEEVRNLIVLLVFKESIKKVPSSKTIRSLWFLVRVTVVRSTSPLRLYLMFVYLNYLMPTRFLGYF